MQPARAATEAPVDPPASTRRETGHDACQGLVAAQKTDLIMNQKLKIGVVMDPIAGIKPYKDSTFAMLLEAQARGYALSYLELGDIGVLDGRAYGRARGLNVMDDPRHWFELGSRQTLHLDELDIILMRKDPPFDMEYIYATYVLDLAAAAGCLVVNHPQALRNTNEKMAITRHADLCAPTLVDRSMTRLREFLNQHGDIVVKPLDGMGGASIFRLRRDDPNVAVVFETLTDHGQRFAMAQRFVEEISEGDKRILLIDGDPVPFALARIPAPGETRGNLAAGGSGEGRELSASDWAICRALADDFRRAGLIFVGIDVIGGCLTEINVTSPTCIRELDTLYDLNIAGQLFDAVARRLS